MTLGRFIIATGEIPIGADANVLARVIDAGEKPLEVQFLQWYGGDSGEFANMHLLPPAVLGSEPPLTLNPGDIPGSIAVTPREYMGGGTWTSVLPQALGADNGGRGSPRFEKFIIPPWYSLAVASDGATAAAWVVTVGAFEVDASITR